MRTKTSIMLQQDEQCIKITVTVFRLKRVSVLAFYSLFFNLIFTPESQIINKRDELSTGFR